MQSLKMRDKKTKKEKKKEKEREGEREKEHLEEKNNFYSSYAIYLVIYFLSLRLDLWIPAIKPV